MERLQRHLSTGLTDGLRSDGAHGMARLDVRLLVLAETHLDELAQRALRDLGDTVNVGLCLGANPRLPGSLIELLLFFELAAQIPEDIFERLVGLAESIDFHLRVFCRPRGPLLDGFLHRLIARWETRVQPDSLACLGQLHGMRRDVVADRVEIDTRALVLIDRNEDIVILALPDRLVVILDFLVRHEMPPHVLLPLHI